MDDIWKFKCQYCGTVIGPECDDIEEALWGHVQWCHENVFEEVQDWETPYMINECYETIKED